MLFMLMSRLYAGIEILEKRIGGYKRAGREKEVFPASPFTNKQAHENDNVRSMFRLKPSKGFSNPVAKPQNPACEDSV